MMIFSFSYSGKRIFHNISFKRALYITLKGIGSFSLRLIIYIYSIFLHNDTNYSYRTGLEDFQMPEVVWD